MQKIRIGTDIRLTIQLRLPNGTLSNIKSAKAFFINTTLQEDLERQYKNKNRFMWRFPKEVFTNEFDSTPYNINSLGYPRYNVITHNYYKGFGLHPNWNECLPFGKYNITEYLAEIQHEAEPNTITVDFPAEAQMFPGVYKLVVVAQIYAPGYKRNIRTITVSYNDIFELSKDGGSDQAATLVVDGDDMVTPSTLEDDIYVISGGYDDGHIILNRSAGASNVDIDVSDINAWYIDE